MAVFLTAAAYYVVGIGEAVVYRERLQDAADTAAFSAAVLNARGMNLLALINMVMAALLAILVALKLAETIIAVAVVLIAGLSFLQPGLATYVPQLTAHGMRVHRAHDSLRPKIHGMLEVLHIAGVAVRTVVPAASVARGVSIARGYEDSPATQAFVVAPGLTLPTQDGRFSDLCDKAGEYAGDVLGFVFSVLPDEVVDLVSDATAELISSGAGWFCGDASAPSTSFTERRHHPVLPSVQECGSMDPARPGYDEPRHQAVCDQADREKRTSEPDAHTGICNGDCDPAAYEFARGSRARPAPRGRTTTCAASTGKSVDSPVSTSFIAGAGACAPKRT